MLEEYCCKHLEGIYRNKHDIRLNEFNSFNFDNKIINSNIEVNFFIRWLIIEGNIRVILSEPPPQKKRGAMRNSQ